MESDSLIYAGVRHYIQEDITAPLNVSGEK